MREHHKSKTCWPRERIKCLRAMNRKKKKSASLCLDISQWQKVNFHQPEKPVIHHGVGLCFILLLLPYIFFFFFLAWGKQVVRINLVCRCPFYLFIKASNIYGAKVMWKHQSNLWQGCWHDCLCFQSAYSLSVEIQYVNNNILILYTILKMQVSTREVQKTFSFWTGFSF